MFLLLTVAGNETTRHSLSIGLQALLERPEMAQRLLADPSLCGTAADEILRWATPVLHFRRTAACDAELHGVRIAEGDKVLLWYAGANFDERQFPDPLTFDVARTPTGTSPSASAARTSASARTSRRSRSRWCSRSSCPTSTGSSWPARRTGSARTSSAASNAYRCAWRRDRDQRPDRRVGETRPASFVVISTQPRLCG